VIATILMVIGVLAISVISKVSTPTGFRAFADAIVGLQVTSKRWSRPMAAASIVAETIVLACLAWPNGGTVGLAAAVPLFGIFTAVLARAVRQGSTVGCHCFGPTSASVSWRHVIRSGFLSVASFFAFLGATALPAVSLSVLGPPQLLLAISVAGILVVALIWLDDLIWLLRGTSQIR